MIGNLLASEGQAPEPAMLNGGNPVLATTPAQAGTTLAAQLAPRLEQAVHESGLFYEAHQAQWLTGRVSTESLRAEPQNRLSETATTSTTGGAKVESAAATTTATTSSAAVRSAADSSAPATSGTANSPAVAEALRPLVQQQLDAASTQRLMWHGEVWPNQAMDWEIRRDSRQVAATPETSDAWNTRLGLTMPQLGRVDARLSLEGNRLRLVLQAGSEATAAPLKARLPELESALAAAGLRLDAAQVRSDTSAQGGDLGRE